MQHAYFLPVNLFYLQFLGLVCVQAALTLLLVLNKLLYAFFEICFDRCSE